MDNILLSLPVNTGKGRLIIHRKKGQGFLIGKALEHRLIYVGCAVACEFKRGTLSILEKTHEFNLIRVGKLEGTLYVPQGQECYIPYFDTELKIIGYRSGIVRIRLVADRDIKILRDELHKRGPRDK